MLFKDAVTVLIIDDDSGFILSVVRSFSGYPNIKADVLVTSTKKPGYFRNSRYIRKIYRELLTEENFERTVKEVIVKSSADIIIPTREWISKLIYRNKESLEKVVRISPLSDVKTIETINDKWQLNLWLENNQFPSSKTFPVPERFENDQVINSLSYPVILKPSLGLGGTGIKLISSRDNLKETVAMNGFDRKEYFIQEYINGFDIGINIFSVDGRILCHNIQKGLFQNQLAYSKGILFVKNPELLQITSDIVSRLKYSGVANLDFRYDSKKGTYVLIDFNARFWSTLDGSRMAGINFPLIVTAYSLGIPIDFPGYTTLTYFLANAAVKTFIGNLFSKKKYPLRLRHTKLAVILKDPLPETVNAIEKLIAYLKKLVTEK